MYETKNGIIIIIGIGLNVLNVLNVLKDGTFEYTYKIKKGISKIKGGIRVLKDMDYPDEIIDTIENQ